MTHTASATPPFIAVVPARPRRPVCANKPSRRYRRQADGRAGRRAHANRAPSRCLIASDAPVGTRRRPRAWFRSRADARRSSVGHGPSCQSRRNSAGATRRSWSMCGGDEPLIDPFSCVGVASASRGSTAIARSPPRGASYRRCRGSCSTNVEQVVLDARGVARLLLARADCPRQTRTPTSRTRPNVASMPVPRRRLPWFIGISGWCAYRASSLHQLCPRSGDLADRTGRSARATCATAVWHDDRWPSPVTPGVLLPRGGRARGPARACGLYSGLCEQKPVANRTLVRASRD